MPRTEYRGLTGGLNNRLAASEIHASEAQDLLNVDFYDRDVRQRPGFLRLNATQDTSGLVGMGLFEFDRKDGTRKRIAKFGTRFVTFDGVGGANTIDATLKTGVDATGQARFASGDNRCVIANRGDNWVYDATTFRRVGVAAPANAPSLAAGAAGTPNGTYEVYFRFIASTTGAQGPKTATASQAVTNQKVTITINAADLAALDGYYDKVAIYVSPPNDSNFYRASSETTSPFSYDMTDAALQALTLDSFSSEPIGVLTGMKSVVYLHGRAFWANDGTNPSRLYFSEVNQPDQVLTSRFITVDAEHHGGITALAVLFDQVVIFKQSAIYLLTPTGATSTWQVVAIVRGTGCVEAAALANVDNRILFLDERGVFEFDGIAVRKLSDRIEGSIVGQMELTRNEFFAAHHDIERKQWLLSYTRKDQTRNDRELVYHYDVLHPGGGGPGPWSIFDREVGAYGSFHDADGNLVTVFSDRIGFLYLANTNDRDGPTASITGTVTAATGTTLSDTTLSPFQPGGSHVLGMKIAIISGTGSGQVREITTVNSPSQVTVDSAWTTTPDTTSVYHVGAINSYWVSKSDDLGLLPYRKRIDEVVVVSGTSSAKVKKVIRRALYHAIRVENLGADQNWRARGMSVRFSKMDHRHPGAGAAVTTTIDMSP